MHAWSLGQKENNNMLPLRRHNFFFPDFGATTFFFLFLPKFRKSPREFPKILGIPKNSREFPEILGNSSIFKKKLNAPVTTFLFFAQQ